MNARMRQRGFSLLEAVVVLSILMITAATAIPFIRSALEEENEESAFQLVRSRLQLARQSAIQERVTYTVAFTPVEGTTAAKVRTDRTNNAGTVTVSTVDIPAPLNFVVVPGAPAGAANTPDGQGDGTLAIDLDRANGGTAFQISFYPDGSARNAAGKYSGGVLYFARPTKTASARAITVMGYTGRLEPWRLRQIPGTSNYAWGPQ